MKAVFASIEAAANRLAQGEIVIVLDSAERENEADFLVAAELISPEAVHFMITHGRGHLCQSILPNTAKRLVVQPLVEIREEGTPRFAMPVDHRECSTGISPVDRARTIRSIVDESSCPEDFIRPGHIFTLIAQEQGVLERPGHTEAAVDLARIAGLAPSGVLCEICSRNGRGMADLYELWELSEKYDLPIVTIDSLIAYREDNNEVTEITQLTQELTTDLTSASKLDLIDSVANQPIQSPTKSYVLEND